MRSFIIKNRLFHFFKNCYKYSMWKASWHFLDELLWTLLEPHFVITLCLIINMLMHLLWASLMAQLVKNSPAIWETWVQYLGWEDPLVKGTATHSSILVWRIPWIVWSMGLQKVRHDWVISLSFYAFIMLLCNHLSFIINIITYSTNIDQNYFLQILDFEI